MEPNQNNLMPPGEVDNEGAMAKADLYKLANYSVKLFKKIEDEDQLESWVQAKITKAADYIASVYHYLEYELKFNEYGAKLENSDVYSESEKRELKNKLNEAREMLKNLKLAQADKLEEAKSPKAKKDWDKDGKIESDKDEVLGSRMRAAKKAGKMKESSDDWRDGDDEFNSHLQKLSEPSEDDVRPLALKLAKGEISYNEFKRKVDELRYADYSMRRGEMGMYESWDDDDEDPDVKKADSELKKRGVKLPKTKADPDKDMSKLAKKSKKDDDLDETYGQGVYESWDDDDEDPDVKKADSELKKRGVKLPKVKHKEVPIKKTAKDKDDDLDEGAGMDTARRYARFNRKVNMASGKDAATEPTRNALTKRSKEYDDPALRTFKVDQTDTAGAKAYRKSKKDVGLDELSHATLKSYAQKKGDQMFKDKKPASGKDLTNYRTAIDKMHKKEDDRDVNEAAPSAGLSKKEKSSVVKKAKAGGDIGKSGKGFAKVEKAAKKSGAKDPKAVAAAAMWKNIKRESINEWGGNPADLDDGSSRKWDNDPGEHFAQEVEGWYDDVMSDINKLNVNFPVSPELEEKIINIIDKNWGHGFDRPSREVIEYVVHGMNEDAESDEGDAYDNSDPKHPNWAQSHLDNVDLRESAELTRMKEFLTRLNG